MSFGEWLRNKLKEKQLSNAELARRTGVSPTYIGNLVRNYSPNTKTGRTRPSEEVVESIARALGESVDDARLAAGYAAVKDLDAHNLLDAVTIQFHRAGKLTKKDQEEILNTVRLITAGILAEKEKDKENESE